MGIERYNLADMQIYNSIVDPYFTAEQEKVRRLQTMQEKTMRKELAIADAQKRERQISKILLIEEGI